MRTPDCADVHTVSPLAVKKIKNRNAMTTVNQVFHKTCNKPNAVERVARVDPKMHATEDNDTCRSDATLSASFLVVLTEKF